MGKIFESTNRILSEIRAKTDAVAVGYSGGKDSMVCLDLCSRTFDRVEAFYYYPFPNLRYTRELIAEAQLRWPGTKFHTFPGDTVLQGLSEGLFCDTNEVTDTLPKFSRRMVFDIVKGLAKVPYIISGAKRSDSIGRRGQRAASKETDIIYPLWDWNKADVLGYLRLRGIPMPEISTQSASCGGISLTTESILWLHDIRPDDYEKVREFFPYIPAVVKRREFYGIGKYYTKNP